MPGIGICSLHWLQSWVCIGCYHFTTWSLFHAFLLVSFKESLVVQGHSALPAVEQLLFNPSIPKGSKQAAVTVCDALSVLMLHTSHFPR